VRHKKKTVSGLKRYGIVDKSRAVQIEKLKNEKQEEKGPFWQEKLEIKTP